MFPSTTRLAGEYETIRSQLPVCYIGRSEEGQREGRKGGVLVVRCLTTRENGNKQMTDDVSVPLIMLEGLCTMQTGFSALLRYLSWAKSDPVAVEPELQRMTRLMIRLSLGARGKGRTTPEIASFPSVLANKDFDTHFSAVYIRTISFIVVVAHPDSPSFSARLKVECHPHSDEATRARWSARQQHEAQ